MSSELKVNYELAQRDCRPLCAKSEFWKYHANQLRAIISDDSVSVDGVSIRLERIRK